MANKEVHKEELSPYKSINQNISIIEKYAHVATGILLSSVSSVFNIEQLKKAKEREFVAFKGKIQYNYKTGEPITKEEWKKLEDAISKFLGIEKSVIEKKISTDSFWLGSTIKQMDYEERLNTSLRDIDQERKNFESFHYRDYDNDRIEISERMSGSLIQNITDKARNKIKTIISMAEKSKWNKSMLFQNLWDQEEDINRDWDRVIRTESAMNANEGFLITALRAKDEDEEYVFLKGVSSPNACKYCKKLISDKIVVLLEKPPKKGDLIVVAGKTYTALWPGKTNYGRKPEDYWSATLIHPYDRCCWTEWSPELENFLNLRGK